MNKDEDREGQNSYKTGRGMDGWMDGCGWVGVDGWMGVDGWVGGLVGRQVTDKWVGD